MTIQGITPTTRFDPALAEAGMRLLTAKHRRAHPRAQVQTLVRIARRASARADWYEELAGNLIRNANDPEFHAEPAHRAAALRQAEENRAAVPAMRLKVRQAAAAMCKLNVEHGLGY